MPLTYPFSFVFSDPSNAYVFMAAFNLVSGTVLLFVSAGLDDASNNATDPTERVEQLVRLKSQTEAFYAPV